MSSNANPAESRLWVDGDGFRAATGTALPTDASIFGESPAGFDAFGGIQAGFTVTKESTPQDLTIWNGGDGPYRSRKGNVVTTIAIRAVDMSKASVLTVLQGGSIASVPSGATAWQATQSYTLGEHVTVSGGITLECTTAGTSSSTPPTAPGLVGGTVTDGTVVWTRSSEVHEWQGGTGEEFSLLLNARDPGYGKRAYYAPRCTLDADPVETVDDQALFGWDFVIKVLAPTGGSRALRTFTDTNPLA